MGMTGNKGAGFGGCFKAGVSVLKFGAGAGFLLQQDRPLWESQIVGLIGSSESVDNCN